MNNPSYFAIIPATVRYDKELEPNAKLLYGEISAMCNVEGFCWAENSYFAELYNVSVFTISRWISKLEKRGHINTDLNKANGNTRKITLKENLQKGIDKKRNTSCGKAQKVLTKNAKGIDEKSKSIYENNTINNTINKREENALSFFKNNCPQRYEVLLMKYKSKINDFQKLETLAALKMVEEKTEFDNSIIEARFERFIINYLEREVKVLSLNQKEEKEFKPAYADNRF